MFYEHKLVKYVIGDWISLIMPIYWNYLTDLKILAE